MNDDEPFALQAMLEYIYTFEYPLRVLHSLLRETMGPDYLGSVAPRPPSAQIILWGFDVAVFRIANKYGLTELAKEAEERFVDDQVEITGEHEGFVSFMRGVYNLGQTAEMLEIRQKVVIAYGRELAKALDEPIVVELIYHIPDLAVDVIKSLATHLPTKTKKK